MSQKMVAYTTWKYFGTALPCLHTDVLWKSIACPVHCCSMRGNAWAVSAHWHYGSNAIFNKEHVWIVSRARDSNALISPCGIAAIPSDSWRFWMIHGDSSESYWWTWLSNFQNQSVRFYWTKLIPHMILKNLSTSHWFWIGYKYGKSLILPAYGPSIIAQNRFFKCAQLISKNIFAK